MRKRLQENIQTLIKHNQTPSQHPAEWAAEYSLLWSLHLEEGLTYATPSTNIE